MQTKLFTGFFITILFNAGTFLGGVAVGQTPEFETFQEDQSLTSQPEVCLTASESSESESSKSSNSEQIADVLEALADEFRGDPLVPASETSVPCAEISGHDRPETE